MTTGLNICHWWEYVLMSTYFLPTHRELNADLIDSAGLLVSELIIVPMAG